MSDRWRGLEEEIIYCRRCERLVRWREEVAREKRRAYREQAYWGKPVPGFGDQNAQILIVGLAPGAHGANRTGRMFTGDASGDFLFRALYKAGFANQATAVGREDGLRLHNVYISAVCRCAPPKNKPTLEEIHNCILYLYREIEWLRHLRVVVALGRIAFDQMLIYYHLPRNQAFEHGRKIFIPNRSNLLIASYHPSRQNTQTRRLTEKMFDQIWEDAKSHLEGE